MRCGRILQVVRRENSQQHRKTRFVEFLGLAVVPYREAEKTSHLAGTGRWRRQNDL